MDSIDILVREEKGCKRVLEIKAPSTIIEKEIERLFHLYRKKLSIPGFRKGRVPLELVKKRYGEGIRKEAIENTVPKIYQEAIQKKDLIPITQATIEKIVYNPPEFGFEASFEILPTPKVENYSRVRLVRRRRKIGIKEVRERIERLRELNAVYRSVEREAREGDYIVFDYEPTEKEGRSRTANHALILKQDEKFFKDLLGARPGEKREIRGEKEELYLVTIKEVKERELPDLDVEFAKDLGSRDMKELEARIKTDLKAEEEERMKEELERQLTEALILENPFDLPESLLEGSENSELAAFQMKKMILLNRIAEMEGIEVKEEEIEAESNGSKLTDGVRRDLRMNLRRRKTIDFLLREAEVSEPEKGIWKRWFQKEK